jgi:hypothetical protein
MSDVRSDLRPVRLPIDPDRSIVVTIHGIVLVTPGADGASIDILIPRAEGSGIPRHEDGTVARPHMAWMVKRTLHGLQPQEISLLDRQVTIEAGSGMPDLELDAMFHLHDFKVPTMLRPFDSGHYASRITLRGGVLRAVGLVGSKWKLNPSPGIGSSPVIRPAKKLEWATSKKSVIVQGLDNPIELTWSESPLADPTSIEIGHQPIHPAEWDKPFALHPHPHTVDDDFKWIYQVIVPTDRANELRPWQGVFSRALPAPTFQSQIGTLLTAETSTCFGACYNCL